MIFALCDYINFRNKKGRYSPKNFKDPMAGSFENRIPEEIEKILETGDVIILGSFNWWVSWLIMFLTSSQVSHLAFYIGDGEILHSTLGGSVREPLNSLYSPGNKILIGRIDISGESRKKKDTSAILNLVGKPYSLKVVIMKGIRIIMGRDWPYFRWRFFFDIALFLIFLDIPLMLYLKTPTLSFLIVIYLIVICANYIIWKTYPLPILQLMLGNHAIFLE